MDRLIVLFVDGIGLGPDTRENPVRELFSDTAGERITVSIDRVRNFKGGAVAPVDPCMGVSGLPQSATGQTSIFTGVNASEVLGYHLTAFPDEKLVEIIRERGLMRRLSEMGVSVTSANLYTREFFEKKQEYDRNMYPVSTLVIKGGGTGLRFIEDYKKGEAVFADITNQLLISRNQGYDITPVPPEVAGKNLLNIVEKTDFVFFEYFLTDLYGHRMRSDKLSECIRNLNRMMKYCTDNSDKDTHFLVVSDHGNAEDLSTSLHTSNKVPMIVFSEKEDVRRHFTPCVERLYHIYNRIIEFYKRRNWV